MPSPPPVLDAGGEAGVELLAYRLTCLLAAVLFPAFGYVYVYADPGVYDPLWMRWALSGLTFGLGLGTYVSARVREHVEALALVLGYVVVAWFTVLTARNALAPEYAVGSFFLLTTIGVANLAMRRLWATVLLAVLATAAGTAVAFALPEPGIDPALYALTLGAAGATICLSTWVRLRLRTRGHTHEARYRTLFEASADGLFFVDAETLAVLDANAAYLALSGASRDQLRARTLYDLVTAPRGTVAAHVRTALKSGHASFGPQPLLTQRGPIDLELSLTRIDQPDRPLLCVTARDLSAQRTARDEAEASREQAAEVLRLKSSLLNNMSHELRTPLVSILGFAELLAEESDEEGREIAETIHRSARRLHDTLNGVLDLAQLESGSVHLNPEVVDVGAEAARIAEELRPQTLQKGLALRVKCAPEAYVLAHTESFRRVLTHLLTNAVKFTVRGGIGLDIEADSHRVLVRVSDTGVGIPEAFAGRVFGAFEQVSTGQDRSFEGSGLGLAVTKRLVDLMGGRIAVKSVEGEGSVFAATFPRTWAQPAASAPGEAGARPPSGDGASTPVPHATAPLTARPRVLIAEDNADTRRLLAHTLADGYEVATASDARSALDLARRTWFDVLLLDVNLGDGATGIDLLKALRAMSAYRFVPALAVTALARPGDRERLLGLGFDGYLAKPFTRSALLDALDDVLEAARSAQSDPGALG